MKLFAASLVIACLVGLLYSLGRHQLRKQQEKVNPLTGYIASDSSQNALVAVGSRFYSISNPEVIRIYDIKKGETVRIHHLHDNQAELSRPPL